MRRKGRNLRDATEFGLVTAGPVTSIRSRDEARLSLGWTCLVTLAVLASTFLMLGRSVANAAPAPAPALAIGAVAQPTTFSAAHVFPPDEFLVTVTNVGAAPTTGPIMIRDIVPAGLEIPAEYLSLLEQEYEEFWYCPVTGQEVECVYEGTLAPGDFLEVHVQVRVAAGATAGPLSPNVATVEGGGAASRSSSTLASIDNPRPFGFVGFDFDSLTRAGIADSQAGDHPYSVTASFDLTSIPSETDQHTVQAVEHPKNALVYLPLGMVGDPTVIPRCPLATVEKSQGTLCPRSSRIGRVVVNTGSGRLASTAASEATLTSAIYNVPPERGYPAQFAFVYFGKLGVMYANVVHVPGGGGYALRVGTPGIPAVPGVIELSGASFTFFGSPEEQNGGGNPAAAAFLTSPTDCSAAPLNARIEVNSWVNPGDYVIQTSAGFPELVGCDSLQFKPRLQVRPESTRADTPAGYKAELTVPQAPPGVQALATPPLREAKVTLPAGVVLSPSAAGGLVGCAATGPQGINIGSDDIGPGGLDLGNPEATELGAGHPGGNASSYDDGLYHVAPGHCPSASQIGEVEVETPLLETPLLGHIYVAEPGCGGLDRPGCSDADAVSGNLYAIYLEAAGSGVIIKLRGDVSADPTTGQLTATFAENPQFPFSELRLSFKGGPRAPLANPLNCGEYQVTASLTPWGAPRTPAAPSGNSFSIDSTPGATGACPASEAGLGNSPRFEAGTSTPLAGSYSPFVLKLSREDGTQRLGSLSVDLPKGLLARLEGTPYCPEAAIASASGRSGTAEKASPSCPAASEVGTVTVGAGPGATPYYVQGRAYLTGPYKGAPLGLAIVTPAVAGPFDLGTVVVRSALYVDQTTVQVTARSDAFPTILSGTPLDIRSIALKLDRSDFTLNPTNCEEMSVSGEAVSTASGVAPLRNRFRVAGCTGLKFAPKLALRVFGRTNRNAKPRFRAVVQMKPGEANIGRAQVNLPHSLFLEQAHIKTICTRVQWAEGNGNGSACPKGSIYGKAKAWTPLLDKPLEGPVYLRSNGGERKLPDLVAALNGQIAVALWGKVDSGQNKGLRNTFEVVPDAPVSKFILEMKGGKKGLLVNSENLCSKKAKRQAIVRFTGQNGAVKSFKPTVAADCPKSKKKDRKDSKSFQK